MLTGNERYLARMTGMAPIDRRFSIAPMMDWTDRHCRAFHRVLTRRALLYSEMATSGAIVHGDVERLIGFDADEHPVALQVGGSDPAELAEAARIGAQMGYAEINLNVGCPSDRVQSGRFGACLMAEPELVGDCVAAMNEAVDIPVTVKCRIGIDDQEPRDALFGFVDTVSARGIKSFTVHARKAWLKGLSPKENRNVPPLDYALVRALKTARPDLEIILNGGLESLDHGVAEMHGVDGIMLGRAAYHTPWALCEVDARLFGESNPVTNRSDAVAAYRPYLVAQLENGVKLHAMTRHMLGLFHGCPGARQWRRILSENANKPGADLGVLDDALSAVEAHAIKAA